ncbi:MAG: bifunctional 23S rRNA (guanine(2069)-N(7))-methyltransferase RlmK/23S rRNA (guanine(2445)-N(2))-methyltransferase RlmL [Gammaproteobacteria bacterium]|nr:bifunctional 23S rRNA (guanine(2069)-N(7))-methyltransferase RlmK/23S rRNA (guanine(2445)-N(2))-methyltransferase RlmL [Gammaproteobacteria bacterium]
MSLSNNYFASCPKGIEALLADELRALGLDGVRETRAGVAFDGRLEQAYRVCLWSRLASRVLLPLARFPAASADALYQGTQSITWSEHINASGTLAVDASVSQSAINHSHFAALKIKDAIVDQMRAAFGTRPSIDTERPDIRLNLYLNRDEATLSLDLSGDSLHRRGYRAHGVEAPLKENLAAAILLRAGWAAQAADGAPLVDLMCGSGTLPIEAALIAGDIAPGLLRPYFGFLYWLGHDAATWEALLTEARERRNAGLARIPNIRGYDSDTRAVQAARKNAERADLYDFVTFEVRALVENVAETDTPAGLAIANPPYGERLGEAHELPALYKELGDTLKRYYAGWRAAVFTGNAELGHDLGLRAHRMHTLYNGAIECRLLRFEVTPEWYHRERVVITSPEQLGSGAEMFANRLRKNLKHFGRWAERQDFGAYRLYDADLHEYNLAIDVYEGDRRRVHVQEYQAPASIDERLAQRRLKHALTVIPMVLEIPPEQLYFKVRRQQKGHSQYEKLSESGLFHQVREGACRFQVNFTDYLDTGLFLDHRPTRLLLGELARGRRFLNLFGYTGTATVHAALGGAASTTTVDMSNTYLDWAQRNFDLNGIYGPTHELIQADVLKWLEQNQNRRYDLIFLDPPTFSRSKRMDDTLDTQRDHVGLIRATAALLEPDGILIFSTNYQRFKLAVDELSGFAIDDITHRTIPEDFKRNARIHQCFRIARSAK